jgi:hypothetical protein
MVADITSQFFTPLSREGNEGIYLAVEELCQKAGVAIPTLTTHTGAHPLLNAMPAAAVLYKETPHIFLNPSMLQKILGSEINFAHQASIPDELKAIVAHELGHIKRGDLGMFGSHRLAGFAPLACMAGTLAGLYAIRSYWSKNKSEKTLPSQKEAEISLKLPENVKSPTLETAKKIALYTVTAIAGLATGVIVGQKLRHNMEYSCDAFSKQIMGSGQPIVSFFKKFGHFMDESNTKMFEKLPEQYRATAIKFIKMIEGLLHPSIESRINRLTR